MLLKRELLFNCTDGTLVVCLWWATVRFHHILKLYYTVLSGLPVVAQWIIRRSNTLFAENTNLIVGRTLVDPSRWKVPVLVSNFSQDTVVVAPFSEVGMIVQVSAIQSITEPRDQPQETSNSLPTHLHDLVSQTSQDLDTNQQHRLANILLQYADLFTLSLDTQMPLNMKLTPVIVHPYVAHSAGCLPR